MRSTTLAVLATMLLFCAASPGSAEDTTPVFGPKQYTREAGRRRTLSETFQHCGTAACQIVVNNGNPDGTNRISSASIRLNGAQIAGPRDFNKQVATIVRPVVLADQNELTIRLTSKPGSFLTVAIECQASGVNLVVGAPGVNLLEPTTLLSALPLGNTGTVDAENVELTVITLPGATLTSPAALPFGLDTIAAGGAAVLNSTFTGGFVPLGSHQLALEGTYAASGAAYCFELNSDLVIPPAAPGSAPLSTVLIPPNVVTDAPFPPRPPAFGPQVNNPSWTVPTAPFEPGGAPPGSTEVVPAPAAAAAAPASLSLPVAGPIVFNANESLGITANVSPTAEPSGASSGGVIFVSANWIAAYSTDGGSSFTALNPTTIFPADAIGFCCDQVVQYVTSIDRFVWLLQGGSGYRLAVASPAQVIASGGTAWTYWNLPPGLFGSCAGFDYPDMSQGNSFLYMSWDAGFGGCNGGLQVARTSFAGLQAGGTITIEFTAPANSPMAWGSHLMHDTGDEIFWAGHNNNRSLRVFSLREDSNTYFWRDVGISSWANNSPLTSLTPDNQNWINFLFNPTTQNPGGGFPANAILGSTRVGSQLWFAWSAGTDSNFPQAHIEMVTLERSDFSKIQQVQIWNPNYAFAYPALSRNACTFEIGLSFEFGGGGNYQNHVVGFWGDFVAYITTGSNVGSTRFGDYVTIRQAPLTLENPGNLFTAFGYGRNSLPPPSTGAISDVHYVLFGRPASSCSIID